VLLRLTPAPSSDPALPDGVSLSTPDLKKGDPPVRVAERVS